MNPSEYIERPLPSLPTPTSGAARGLRRTWGLVSARAALHLATLGLAALLAAGCAERLEAEGDPDGGASAIGDGGSASDSGASDGGASDGGASVAEAGMPPSSGRFQHAVGVGGVVTTVVDASDAAELQRLDLDTGHARDDSWDLGFSRFRVVTNGGISGDGGVLAAALLGQDFEDLTQAPTEGWMADATAAEDSDFTSSIRNAFHREEGEWYAYELSTHSLTPEDITFVVASTGGRFYKLRFEAYYDDAGSPAIVTMRWAELDAPDGPLEPSSP